jgi:hypothetical protein
MKSFQMPMLSMSLLGLCLLSGLEAPPVHADFTFSEPTNLKSMIPVLDGASDVIDCFSHDGLEMYIESERAGGSGGWDLCVLNRASIDDEWGLPENLGPSINSSNIDALSFISADGLTLYFDSNRPSGHGSYDIYMTTRTTRDAPWEPAVNLGPKINSSAGDGSPWISPDGLEFYFGSFRSGGYGGEDIYVMKRATTNDPWGEPLNLGPIVNSVYEEHGLCLSPDGLLLFFCDNYVVGTPRPGGYGAVDMWMTRRASVSDPWQAPVNLGSKVNGANAEGCARLSLDGRALYFFSNHTGGWENYEASIEPVVDFNGDGIVDAADVCIMIEHWLTDYPLCDIGPMPWGDGIVDVQDLIVLSEHLFEEIPPAEELE